MDIIYKHKYGTLKPVEVTIEGEWYKKQNNGGCKSICIIHIIQRNTFNNYYKLEKYSF
jgi:hypothetical protein